MKKISNKVKLIIAVVVVLLMIAILIVLKMKNKRDYELEIITNFDYYVLSVDKKQGVITKEGNVVVDANYDKVVIPNPTKEVFFCYNLKPDSKTEYDISILNSKSEKIFDKYEEVTPIALEGVTTNLPYEKSVLRYKKDNKYGLINYEGKVVVKAKYEEVASLKNKEGEILVKAKGKYGVINKNGVKLVKLKYDEIIGDGFYIEEDKYKLAGYIVSNKLENKNKYGYINYKGKTVLQQQYDKIERITDCGDKDTVYILANKDGKSGVTKNKENILDFDYQTIEYNKINNVFLASMSEKFGVYDIQGKIIIEREYDKIAFKGKYVYAKNGDKEKYFCFESEKLSNNVFEKKVTEENNEYVCDTAKKNDKILKYRGMYPTENEKYYISADENEKYGVVDNKGKEIIPNEYTYLEYVAEDYFIGLLKGKLGIISASGDIILEFKYSALQRIKGTNVIEAKIVKENITEIYSKNLELVATMNNVNLNVYKDYIEAYSEQEVRYFDFDGNEKTNKEIFKDNEIYAFQTNLGKWTYVDKEGNSVVRTIYDMATEFNKAGYAAIKVDGKWGVINKNCEIILKPEYVFSSDNEKPDFLNIYIKKSNNNEVYYTNKI